MVVMTNKNPFYSVLIPTAKKNIKQQENFLAKYGMNKLTEN